MGTERQLAKLQFQPGRYFTRSVADYAAWRYQNRDAPGENPPWLKLELRELYLSSHAKESTDATVV